jgi:hypothetical protein
VSDLPLYGFKTLRYKDGGLYSLIPAEWYNYRYRLSGTEWECEFPGASFYPYENFELNAICIGDDFRDPCLTPPSHKHNCGIHASWSMQALESKCFWDKPYLMWGPLLVVTGWGKTIIHEEGWRAACARIVYRVTNVNDGFGSPDDLPRIHIDDATAMVTESKEQFVMERPCLG